MDDYWSNDQSNLVVSNFTRPVANASTYNYVFSSCDNATSVSNNGGCSGFKEEPVISCIDSKCIYNNEDTLDFCFGSAYLYYIHVAFI